MKKITLGVFILTSLLFAGVTLAHTADDPFTTALIAGQHINVGTVSVWNDDTNLYVEYETTNGWEITETHLYVGKNSPALLTSAPGQFPYSDDNPYAIPLGEIDSYSMELNKKGKPTGKLVADGTPGVEPCSDIYIAAHAVVQKTTIITEAPYYASVVVDYSQGLRKDGTPVRWQRSTPEQGLVFETGQNEFNFFSLGFGGWIIIEFDCPIRNGEGNDIKVIEDTWGSYPLETADVSASQDGIVWTYLGEADNTNQAGIHTISEFDLGSLDWAKYIKVVDTSDPAVHNSGADGYDLNAVESLQDCVQTEEETAWGNGDNFGTNWAMYFNYHVQCVCEEVVLWQIGDEEVSQLDNPVDELNWPGMFGVFPVFPDPFVEGTNNDSEFPWNSNYVKGYATDFDVQFDYSGPTVNARLTVSWSPGKSAYEQKEVFLDGLSLGKTEKRLGTAVSGWWNNMAVYQDTFDFTLTDGLHTLNFQHLMGDGTLWDFVRLETICTP